MKKVLLMAVAALVATSCATPTLYYWGSRTSKGYTTRYEQLTYKNYDKQTPESICDLVCLYEDMVSHPGGSRKTVPPGICAEYGFLLLQPSTAETFEKYATKRQRKVFQSADYASIFAERGAAMMQKEIELYPESAKFIAPLLKRLTGK